MPLTEALEMGEHAWDGLLARSGSSSPFMTWAWHRAWAGAVAPAELEACQAIVLRSSIGAVDAVVPLRLHRAPFHRAQVMAADWPMSDLGCPDHLDLLASPDTDCEALVDALEAVPWDVLRLANVAEDASRMRLFQEACESRGWTVHRRPLWRCPYLELPGSWDELLAGLGQNARTNVPRYERRLHKKHDVELTDYATRWEEGWRVLRQLHDLRWAGTGALRDPRLEELHRGFGAWLAERGRLWLVTLDLDGSPAAAWYGFASNGTVYFYQAGRDPQWEGERVGTVLMSLMLRRAIDRGLRGFDFLRGEEWYKSQWTGTTRTCYEVVITRPGFRGAVLRGLDWVAQRRARVWVPH
jgi:CelD/BcsL family acetyltransferase involved in cellulose biosynthesis